MRALILAAALVLVTIQASAQEPSLTLPPADAMRAAEELRDARAAKAIIETLKAEIEKLRLEGQAREIALAIAEDREKRRQDDDARVTKALERAEQAIERSERALDKAQARIERLETRQFWMGLLGPIGLLLGFAAGAF